MRIQAPAKIEKRFLIHERKIARLQRRVRKWLFWRKHGKQRNHIIEEYRTFNLHKRFNRERTYWHRHLSVL